MKRSLKIVAGLGALLVLLVVALLVLPFVVDFNRFKPRIQALVAERVNARIDFESARLTVLTGLGVKLTKVTIENTDPKFAGTRLFAVDELVFRTAVMPLLEKRFVGYVKIDRPEIVVVRRGLSNNLGALLKETNPGADDGSGAPDGGTPNGAPGGTPGGEAPETPAEREARRKQIEELKRNVVIESLTIDDASLTLREVTATGSEPGAGTASSATGATSESVRIRDLDLSVTNIGADRDVRVLLTTQAGVSQPGLRVNGPVELSLNLKALTAGTEFKELDFKGRFNLDKMSINAADGAFSKSEGIPLHAEFEGTAFPDALELPRFKARLQNLELDLTASVKDFTRKDARIALKASSADLAKLAEVLPKHRSYLVNATIDLDAGIEGALETPEKVKSRVALKTALAGTDLSLDWKSDHLKPLQGRLLVDSKRLDVAGLLAPFTGGASAAPAKEDGAGAGTAATAGSGAGTKAGEGNKAPAGGGSEPPPEEFALTPAQKELLAGSDVQARVNIEELLYKDFRIVDLKLDAALEGLGARLKELSLQAFGGRAAIDGLVNLSAVPLSFRGKIDLDSVNAEEVLAFTVPEHKDVLAGRMSLDLNVDGRGSAFPTISKTLNGKGSFVFEDGELKTQSVTQLAQKQFDEKVATLSVVKAADDIVKAAESIVANPLVKQAGGLKGFDLEKYKKEYDSVRNVRLADKADVERSIKDVKGTLEIREGRIHLTSKNGGRDGELDFKGSVGLDLTLQGQAVFTAGEPLEQKMMSQSKYATLLLDEGNNLSLPMTLAGTVKAPQVKVDLAPLQQRFTTKARALAEAELRKKAEEEVNRLLKGQADKAIADIKKKAGEEGKKLEEKAKKEAEKALGKDPKKALKEIFGKKKK